MGKNKGCFIIIFLFFWLLSSFSSLAQEPETILNIVGVSTEEGEESLALTTFFAIANEQGKTISDARIEKVEIELLGENREVVEAKFKKPETPAYVVLLLDASGSMEGVIQDVKAAAKAAIEDMPPMVNIAVVQFSDDFRVLTDFTNDHQRINEAIDGVQIIYSTCLYDATYQAIDMLNRQISSSQDRRAIILFTDGQDRLNGHSTTPCSTHTFREVIDHATPNDQGKIPIYTVGLCSSGNSCGNINQGELQAFATETSATWAIGSRNDLAQLFNKIVASLRNQWVANANLHPVKGHNQAVLRVKLRDQDLPLTETFTFYSSRNYIISPNPTAVYIDRFNLNQDTLQYLLALQLDSPNLKAIDPLEIQIWDKAQGIQTPQLTKQISQPTKILTVEFDATNLEIDKDYLIRVLATNTNGDRILNIEEETLLVEHAFTHYFSQAEPHIFRIESVNAQHETKQLFIDLHLPQGTAPAAFQSVEGFIINAETGGKVYTFGPEPLTAIRIQTPLPHTLREGSFQVTVRLTSIEGLVSEAIYENFNPKRPNFLSRIITALANNSTILLIIIAIIASIIGWLLYDQRLERRRLSLIRHPPIK